MSGLCGLTPQSDLTPRAGKNHGEPLRDKMRGQARESVPVPESSGHRCYADVLILVNDIVQRVLRALLDLEDADDMIGEIAVFVEGDLSLQGVDVGVLDRVTNIASGY